VKDNDFDNMINKAIKRGALAGHPYSGSYALRVRASEYNIVKNKLSKLGYHVSTGSNPYNNYNVFSGSKRR
jgi:hypothetical protein